MIPKTLILFLFFPLLVFGQHLECCETKKDIETYLSGKWEIADSASKTIYQYWFEDGKGHLDDYEPAEKEGELLVEDSHVFVEIIKYDNGFKLKYTYLYGNWISELKYLNAKKLILLTDGKEVVYHKIE